MTTPHTNPEIALHIGAHKTATTHLQHSIMAKRAPLTRLGVRYFGPPQLRGDHPSILRRFGLPGAEFLGGDPIQMRDDMLAGGHRLVLSEENFAAALLTKTGGIRTPLYGKASERITALSDNIAPDGVEVFLSVRQPTTFVSSAYGQHLLSGGDMPLYQFLDKNRAEDMDWVDLVKRLSRTRGIRRLVVWAYEDYGNLFAPITKALLGSEPAQLVKPLKGKVHSGLSTPAVEEILARHDAGAQGDFWTVARGAFPVNAVNPPFDAFTQEAHDVSAKAYAAQINKIAVLPKVTFLRP